MRGVLAMCNSVIEADAHGVDWEVRYRNGREVSRRRVIWLDTVQCRDWQAAGRYPGTSILIMIGMFLIPMALMIGCLRILNLVLEEGDIRGVVISLCVAIGSLFVCGQVFVRTIGRFSEEMAARRSSILAAACGRRGCAGQPTTFDSYAKQERFVVRWND